MKLYIFLLFFLFVKFTWASDPFIKVHSVEIKSVERGLQLEFKMSSNTSMGPSMEIKFYLNGKISSNKIEKSAPEGENKSVYFHIPYTDLFVPPGKNILTYKIFGRSFKIKQKEFFKDEVEFHQPQLFWVEFETKNADIDVDRMDLKYNIGHDLPSNIGKGLGDAYFQIENFREILFKSPSVYNSGRIKNQKGKFQTYETEPLIINFFDLDVLTKEFIGKHELKLKKDPNQKILISKSGRITHFEFNYTLKAVTKANFSPT